MKRVEMGSWIHYLSDDYEPLNRDKSGKWMHFFNDLDFADKICQKAVLENIVKEAKHDNAPSGVCCFYLEIDDMEAHKRVINFFLEHNLIRKTKTGKLYNISFKLNNQTRIGEYGDEFKSELKLADLLDLQTGEWLSK